jgi:predicted deacylase
LANTFTRQIVAQSDYGIDLHTGALNRCNLPQIRGNLDDAKTLELARAFGVPVIINANIRDGSLRDCAAERGMPVLTYEAGEALRFEELGIHAGLRGVLNVMRTIGMLPGRINPLTPVLAQSTIWVRAPVSGIIRDKMALGSAVDKGQRLAMIGDPLGDHEEAVLAPCDGIIIGRNNLPLTHEGNALFNVALFTSVSGAEDLVEEFTAMHEHAADGGSPAGN